MALALITAVALMSGCAGSGAETSKSVSIAQMSPSAMLQSLKAGEIDGFVAWEPFDASAVTDGFGTYLVESKDIWPGHPCCVIAVKAGSLPPSAITAVLWAHVKSTEFLNASASSNQVAGYAEQFTGYPAPVVERAIAGVKFVSSLSEELLGEYVSALEEQGLLVDSGDTGDAQGASWRSMLDPGPLEEVKAALAADESWVPSKVSEGTTVRLGFIGKDLHQLATFVAQHEGYYEAVGLRLGSTLEMRPYPNGVAIMQAFQAGELDIAYLGAAPALLRGLNDRIPIRLIAGVNEEGSALVVRAAEDINSATDLAGRTIAVPQVGTVQYVLLNKYLAENGLESKLK